MAQVQAKEDDTLKANLRAKIAEMRTSIADSTKKLAALETALAALEGSSVETIDAAEHYIRDKGRPVPLDAIVTALVEQGVNRNKEKPAKETGKSIKYWIRQGRLKQSKDGISINENWKQ